MDVENVNPGISSNGHRGNVKQQKSDFTNQVSTHGARTILGAIGNRNELSENTVHAVKTKPQIANDVCKPQASYTLDKADVQEPIPAVDFEKEMQQILNDECMEVDIQDEITDQENDETSPVFSLAEIEVAFREPCYHLEATENWKLAEKKYMPVARYMRRQREIDWDMRSTLVDWLVEVGEEFKLNNETLFLAVAYLDRFLSIMSCSRDKLQLAGVSAMFISSKYEEIYPPTASEFVNLTDNTYNTRQLLKLEISMLKALKFEVSSPTASAFLLHMIQNYDNQLLETNPECMLKLENLAKYICELTLLQGEVFLNFMPSQIAASSLYIAAATLSMNDWIDSVPTKSGYSLKELEACIRYVHKYYLLAPRLSWTAIQDKYRDPRFGGVATIEGPKCIPLKL